MRRPYRWYLPLVGLTLLVGSWAAFSQPPEPEQGPELPAPPSLDRRERSKTAPGMESSSSEAPLVVLEKNGPRSITIGKSLTTETVVRNQGQVAAYQVRVEDEIPSNAKFLKAEPAAEVRDNRLIWNFDKLPPASERRLKIEWKVSGEGEVISKANVTYSTNAAIKTRILRPQLAVKKTGPDRLSVSDTAAFQIEVSNPGNGPATGVTIRDHLPDGFQHPEGSEIEADIGTLAPGEIRKITLKAKAVKTGRYVNEVIATGDDGLEARASVPVTVGQAVLKLAKTGPGRRYLNTEAVYTIQVTNVGDAPARNTRVIDALPPGFVFLEAGDGGTYDSQSHTVTWNLDSLQPNDVRNVNVRVKLTEAGEQRNQAIARAEPNVQARADTPVKVLGLSALLLEVVDSQDPVEVGAETVYDIRVANQGSAPMTNMRVLAMAPDGLSIKGANATVPHQVQGRQVIFQPLPTLAPKAEAVFKVAVSGDAPGDHRFKVQIESDQLRIPVTEEESTHVYKGD